MSVNNSSKRNKNLFQGDYDNFLYFLIMLLKLKPLLYNIYIIFSQLYIYIYIQNIYEMKIFLIFLLGLGFWG